MRPRGLRDNNGAKKSSLRQPGGQSTMRVRSLRDVQAAEAIVDRPVPTTHAQRFAEIAWLERESERLQREASVLEATKLRIQTRMTEISDRRTFLLNLVRESLQITQPEGSETRTAKAKTPEEEAAAQFDTFSLEY